MSGRKIFVGSLPDGVSEATLRSTFQQFGLIEDTYIKQGCEPGRQWAFITFATAEQAMSAKEQCDRALTFPGMDRPCDVMVARNQGMYGQNDGGGGGGSWSPQQAAPPASEGPKKIFVGSLPDNVTAEQLQMEFCKYGVITDTYIKEGCEPGRQWSFVTFSSGQEAQLAKVSTDRVLFMPGAARPCEVTLARNQGMYGQGGQDSAQPVQQAVAPVQVAAGPKKIFVGSLPDNCSEQVLRAEFSSFGHITDVFLKTGCEPGRQWGFVTFAASEQAAHAKEATDRILFLPGAQKACEVMLAKNQGMYGQDNMKGGGGGPHQQASGPQVVPPTMGGYGGKNGGGYGKDGGGYGKAPAGQPPPPTTPPPSHLTPWRNYHTAAGLPYYHNHSTGATQWETPPEFQVASQKGSGKGRYSAY